MSNEKEFPKVTISWDDTANAKLPKSVQKWTFYDFNIFRNLLEIDIIPPKFDGLKTNKKGEFVNG